VDTRCNKIASNVARNVAPCVRTLNVAGNAARNDAQCLHLNSNSGQS